MENKNIYLSATKTSWKDGSLLFENHTLEKVMEKIQESYGCTIVFKDKETKNKLITGAVPIRDFNTCLEVIKKSVNVNISRQENKLIIAEKE